ncbi:MAG TPA: chitinase [Legionella sp.]|nr:chitinase [Legionella sp.]
MMPISRILSVINGVLLSTNVVAASMQTPPFSPYVDYTLNTHWDPETQDMAPMDLVSPAVSQGITSFHLAFITDSGSCQPSWGGQQDYSLAKHWGAKQADRLVAHGVDLAVSFGGATGNDLSYHCTPLQLIDTFNQVIDTYHAKTLDFDIENGTADIPKLMSAIKVTQIQHPDINLSFTLPVMPEGLTSAGKDIISAAYSAGLHFQVNIMAMDYGPAYSGDMGAYAIAAASHTQQFLKEIYPDKSEEALWKLVKVTPMIGVNDVNTEQFTLANVDELKKFAKNTSLGGLSMWSLSRDIPCADKWASPVCSGNNLQHQQYEFVGHFIQ